MRIKTIISKGILSLLMTFAATQVHAQQFTDWAGNDISTVLSTSTDQTAGSPVVFLYNVGTHRFLTAGSDHGTSIVAQEHGLPVYLYKATDAASIVYYNILSKTTGTNNGNFFGQQYYDKSLNVIQAYQIFTDTNTGVSTPMQTKFSFELVDATKKTYRIVTYKSDPRNTTIDTSTGRYVVANSSNTHKDYTKTTNGIDYVTSSGLATYGDNALWKIVTRQDAIDRIKTEYSSSEAPADVTFLIKDEEFFRATLTITQKSWSESVTGLYNIGWGVNSDYKNSNGDIPYGDDQLPYGKYSNAFIKYDSPKPNVASDADMVTKKNGDVYQDITLPAAGWYRLSCSGFVRKGAGSTIHSELFATYNGKTRTADLPDMTDNTITTPKEAGIAFAADRFADNTVLIYVPQTDFATTQTMRVGIRVENSNKLDDWTAFDKFSLQYVGNVTLFLDDTNESLDAINGQVNTNLAKTLIMKRDFLENKWNSLVSPVEFNKLQFKAAFGSDAQVYELKGPSADIKTQIDFTKVDIEALADNGIAIQKNKLYIIYPTNEPILADNSTISIQDGANGTKQVTFSGKYVTAQLISLKESVNDPIVEAAKTSSLGNTTIQFKGTYINHTAADVPAGSYVVATDGRWHYTSTAHTIKGFRAWIATASPAPAKDLTFSFDGVVEDVALDIDGLTISNNREADRRVYNLQGQMVAEDATQLSTLPKGIYIVGNKKIMNP